MKMTKTQLKRIIKEELKQTVEPFSGEELKASMVEDAIAPSLDQKISKAVEMIETGSVSDGVALLYDILEDLRSDDQAFNPTL